MSIGGGAGDLERFCNWCSCVGGAGWLPELSLCIERERYPVIIHSVIERIRHPN